MAYRVGALLSLSGYLMPPIVGSGSDVSVGSSFSSGSCMSVGCWSSVDSDSYVFVSCSESTDSDSAISIGCLNNRLCQVD